MKTLNATFGNKMELTKANYYLAVKTLQEARKAMVELYFIKILGEDKIQITNINRINLKVFPLTKDGDLSKGVVMWLGGNFADSEMIEITRLSKYSDSLWKNY